MFIGEEAARRLHPIGVPWVSCQRRTWRTYGARLVRSAASINIALLRSETPCSCTEAFFILRDKDDS
jgi:hypothetical protein